MSEHKSSDSSFPIKQDETRDHLVSVNINLMQSLVKDAMLPFVYFTLTKRFYFVSPLYNRLSSFVTIYFRL